MRSNNMADFSETSIEVLGIESQYGAQASVKDAREVCVKIAARHPQENGIGLLLRETTGLALSGPPGLSGFAGTRPRPSAVLEMFACLLPREELQLEIHFEGETLKFVEPYSSAGHKSEEIQRPALPIEPKQSADTVSVPLIKLAYGRSGDKGNKANIGIIARDNKYLPLIWAQLTNERVAHWFEHFLDSSQNDSVERYFLPGIGAINFVLNNALGGGGTASLRNDPQGKGYAQLLLAFEIEIPVEMATELL